MEKKKMKEERSDKPKYEAPRIEVFDEDELLKNVAVLGCYPFPP